MFQAFSYWGGGLREGYKHGTMASTLLIMVKEICMIFKDIQTIIYTKTD